MYTTVGSERISANVVTLGRKLNYETDLALQFGEYVDVHEHDRVTNTGVSRTEPAIALMPTGSVQGTWWFLRLRNMKPVKRERWTALPIPATIIELLNQEAVKTRGARLDPTFVFEDAEIAAEDGSAEYDAVRGGADGPVRDIREVPSGAREEIGVSVADGNVLTEGMSSLSSGVTPLPMTFESTVANSADEGVMNVAQLEMDAGPWPGEATEPAAMRSPALDAHEEDFYEEAGVMDEAAAESAEGLMTPEEPSRRVLRPRVVRNIGDKPMR